jgi:hypothetical protein
VRQISEIAVVFFSVLGIGSAAYAGGIIVDGGFEAPSIAPASFRTLNAGDSTLSPWVISLTSVDLVSENGGAIIGPAFEGRQYLDLDGTPGPGELTQSFKTTPGATYELSFAYANNYFAGPPVASASVSVFDGFGTLLGPTTILHGSSHAGDLNWTVFTGDFIASAAMASVDFRSLDGRAFGGILLDAVSIRSVPEPSGFLLMSIGGSGLIMCIKSFSTKNNYV